MFAKLPPIWDTLESDEQIAHFDDAISNPDRADRWRVLGYLPRSDDDDDSGDDDGGDDAVFEDGSQGSHHALRKSKTQPSLPAETLAFASAAKYFVSDIPFYAVHDPVTAAKFFSLSLSFFLSFFLCCVVLTLLGWW